MPVKISELPRQTADITRASNVFFVIVDNSESPPRTEYIAAANISFGSTGFTGSNGYTGSIGSVGFRGSIGFTGSRGYEGSQGATGFTGSSGSASVVIDTKTIVGNTGYTLVYPDASRLIEISTTSGSNTVFIPNDGNTNFDIGTQLVVLQTGNGVVNVAGQTSVVINSRLGLTFGGRWSAATLIKRGANNWVVIGDMRSS